MGNIAAAKVGRAVLWARGQRGPFAAVFPVCITSFAASPQAVAEIIRTTLGPRSMLKMLLDPMGGIAVTNDGNAILREIDVSHPAAKNMIELSRAQDEEVGDGTTSVIILGARLAGLWGRVSAWACVCVVPLVRRLVLCLPALPSLPLRGDDAAAPACPVSPVRCVFLRRIFLVSPCAPQPARSWPPRSPSC